jgi:hypothetical protein
MTLDDYQQVRDQSGGRGTCQRSHRRAGDEESEDGMSDLSKALLFAIVLFAIVAAWGAFILVMVGMV